MVLPRSTLPSPDGFFGRLSTLAAGFGLPAWRFALAGLPAGRWLRLDCRRAGRRSACWLACSRPAALALQPVERALADVSRPVVLPGALLATGRAS